MYAGDEGFPHIRVTPTQGRDENVEKIADYTPTARDSSPYM